MRITKTQGLWLASGVILASLLAWIIRPTSSEPIRDSGVARQADSPHEQFLPATVGAHRDAMESQSQSVESLVNALVGSKSDGMAAYLRLQRLEFCGLLLREKLSGLLLSQLRVDASMNTPELCNVSLCASTLLADHAPTEETRQSARAYREVQNDRESHQQHKKLSLMIDNWPPPRDADESIRQRLDKLLARGRSHDAVGAELKRMLLSREFEDREAALAAIAKWVDVGPSESENVQVGIDVLLQTDGLDRGITELMAIADAAQLNSGSEQTRPGVSVLGTLLALRLQDPTDSSPLSSDEREALVQALANHQSGSDSRGAALFACMVLGGARDNDPNAIQSLTKYVTDSESRVVRNTAIVNLGNVADLSLLLQLSGFRIDRDPQGTDTPLDQVDFFSAVHNVLTRHPEDSQRAGELYREALTQWRTSAVMKRHCSMLLNQLTSLPIVELEDVITELATDPSYGLVKSATSALDALRQVKGQK